MDYKSKREQKLKHRQSLKSQQNDSKLGELNNRSDKDNDGDHIESDKFYKKQIQKSSSHHGALVDS